MSLAHEEDKGSSSDSAHRNQEEKSAALHAESKSHSQAHGGSGFSLSPPPPPNDEKKHWSATEDGALVARATAHVYRAIIATQSQGGMKDFLEEKCSLFLDISGEQSLECTTAFQHYEKHIDDSLEDFAKSEGKSCVEIMQIIERVASSHKKAAKNLDMLLAATGYNKFSKMMHRKAVEKETAIMKQKEERARNTADRQGRALDSSRCRIPPQTSMGKPDSEGGSDLDFRHSDAKCDSRSISGEERDRDEK